jgi:hypothetical protein
MASEDGAAKGQLADQVPALRHLATFSIEGGQPLELGSTPYGRRRVVSIRGGEVTGPRLSGRILDSGADAALIRHDGVFEQDVGMVIETTDGALIRVTYRGRWQAEGDTLQRLLRREGDLSNVVQYLRTAVFFETGSNRYEWLNSIVAVGAGVPQMGTTSAMKYEIFEVV